MSNEYKDWYNDLTKEEKLCLEFPFLICRDIDGTLPDKDYHILCLEIPKGWKKLFFQMCKDIKDTLISTIGSIPDDFYFIQVKEKYNQLRCYVSNCPNQDVLDILSKYESMAKNICIYCGQPAEYVTQGYIASICREHWKDWHRHEKVNDCEIVTECSHVYFTKGKTHKRTLDFTDEWNRYLSSLRQPII